MPSPALRRDPLLPLHEPAAAILLELLVLTANVIGQRQMFDAFVRSELCQ